MATSSPPPGQSLLDHSSFIAFWLSGAASGFAFQMLSVAIGWQIYELTGRAFDLGLIGLVQLGPAVLLALPAGHVADQFDRRRVVLLARFGEACGVVALAALTFLHGIHEVGVLALLFTMSICRAFEFPGIQALLPTLVPAPLLPRAISLNASAGQAATIAGPALGGLLYAIGPGIVYAVAGALSLIGVLLMARVEPAAPRGQREPATLKTLFAGVEFIIDRPDVLGVISLDLFAVLLGGATALLPIFAKDILHTGPWGLGLLRAAPAVGALLMSFWMAAHTLRKNVGLVMYACVAGFGVSTIVFAISKILWLSLIALFALGAFDMVSMVIRGALVQLDTPDTMRGRVSAVNAIFIDTSNQLGEFESGLLAAWLGAMQATLIGGIGTLVVVATWMLIFPTLRKRQGLTAAPDP